MGILAALDYNAERPSGLKPLENEVEYRLFSWGEILGPFVGDREHSTLARFILHDFPFKLFISSTSGSLPQHLSLCFRAPHEIKDTRSIHIEGLFPHEIAQEFAAFLSLVTRRRVIGDMQCRMGGLPIEDRGRTYYGTGPQERQRAKEINPGNISQLLESLRLMNRQTAEGYMLAMRLYYAAIQMLFSEPEFAYLLLITSLEAISSVVCKEYRPPDIELFLSRRSSKWKQFATAIPSSEKTEFINFLLANEKFILQKMVEFTKRYLPEAFWTDKEDDAKPVHFVDMIRTGFRRKVL